MYTSLDSAIRARSELVQRIQAIEAQLAGRAAEVLINPTNGTKYLEWKSRACKAKSILTFRLQRTKAWISKQRELEAALRIEQRGGETRLLSDLYSLTKSLVSAGAPISQDQQLLLDDVGAHLSTH